MLFLTIILYLRHLGTFSNRFIELKQDMYIPTQEIHRATVVESHKKPVITL